MPIFQNDRSNLPMFRRVYCNFVCYIKSTLCGFLVYSYETKLKQIQKHRKTNKDINNTKAIRSGPIKLKVYEPCQTIQTHSFCSIDNYAQLCFRQSASLFVNRSILIIQRAVIKLFILQMSPVITCLYTFVYISKQIYVISHVVEFLFSMKND